MASPVRNVVKGMFVWVFIGTYWSCSAPKTEVDLSNATILISPTFEETFRETAGTVLMEEVEKRTQKRLPIDSTWEHKTIIALVSSEDVQLYEESVPVRSENSPEYQKEGYRLLHETRGDREIIWVIGADKRGVLYGLGKLLRAAQMSKGNLSIINTIDISESPLYALRGHQFGYRDTANSWDAWTVEQFDQHFREQVLFGANSFENIPFQDPESSAHFKVDPQLMEVEMSKICDKYGANYWAWTPAPKDLTEKGAHADGLAEQETFYARCPRLDGIFVPGGDPGDNHPSVLIPYLEDLAKLLKKYHPNAGIWVSLQGFDQEKVDYFFHYLKEHDPDWLAGVVNGPSSPPVDQERDLLPEKYGFRFYPDITHTVRCHYPVEKWDQAYALTLGREPCNPQPLHYTKLFRRDIVHTDGFITYSDGTHDDVNKIVWNQLGWNPEVDLREVLVEYGRFFFGPAVAETVAEGILALERNWEGPLLGNAQVPETLSLWMQLETENPELANNWRWQQLVMRAYYDAYIQDRLAHEKKLEDEAYAFLGEAEGIGADKAMEKALGHLNRAMTEPVSQDLRQKVVDYAEALFQSIGAQTSVPKYKARGAERGAILDFLDHPLNNRWWLEDEFARIKETKTEEEKLKRLHFIIAYEHPGEGSFYDNISSADARHVTSATDDAIDYLWENNGSSRKRLSTQLFQFAPTLAYEGLDPNADYLIRVSGYGEALLRANGERLKPTKYEKGFEEFKEFPLPKELIKDGRLSLSFDKPDEDHLNWRVQSKVTDVWVLKQ